MNLSNRPKMNAQNVVLFVTLPPCKHLNGNMLSTNEIKIRVDKAKKTVSNYAMEP